MSIFRINVCSLIDRHARDYYMIAIYLSIKLNSPVITSSVELGEVPMKFGNFVTPESWALEKNVHLPSLTYDMLLNWAENESFCFKSFLNIRGFDYS
ncbi:hypothetical protein T01_12747 [Trichinella spiralis]|uniref:Uncharacterized protein n=1 Tax=Trichinella spiralis TaxID=6334 RepID=A0A0V1C1D0_TRISP|nr:hypothetical protein T01_12747 [Trichinella spiralis]